MSVLELGTWNLGQEDCPQLLESVLQSKSAFKLYKLAKENNVFLKVKDNISCRGYFHPRCKYIALNSNLDYPATTFAHEMVHYLQHKSNPDLFNIDEWNPDRTYANRIYLEIAAYKMTLRVLKELDIECLYDDASGILYSSPNSFGPHHTIIALIKSDLRLQMDFRRDMFFTGATYE